MLYLLDVSVDTKDWTLDQLWESWEKEAEAAEGAIEAGLVVGIYKVVGQRRAIAILDMESHDQADAILMAGLPMAHNLIVNDFMPLRPYENFANDVRARWQG